jgi:hypothetical protein
MASEEKQSSGPHLENYLNETEGPVTADGMWAAKLADETEVEGVVKDA